MKICKKYISKYWGVSLVAFLVASYPASSSADKKETGLWNKMIETGESLFDSSIKSLNVFLIDLEKKIDAQISEYENAKEKNENIDIRDKIDSLRLYVENINRLKKDEENASTFTIISSSKKDYRIKIDEVLAELEGTLFDGEIVNYAERIRSIRENNKRLKRKQVKLNEDFVFATEEKKIFGDNKSEIKAKISDISVIIDKSEKLIGKLEFDLKRKMDALGIKLTRDQIRVMTTRVDGDDLSKTFAIFDVTRQISNTLGRLMKENMFSAETTVQYYGIYVILCEILGYSQRTYIKKINVLYLPALDRIEDDIKNSLEFTNNALKNSSSKANKLVLQKNIGSSEFSLKVLKQYKEILLDQKKSLTDALRNTREQITVAYSSYDTAAVSANLLNLINQTQSAFDKIMDLQMPKIIPFSDIALQRKFEEISDKLVLNTTDK